MADPVTLPHLTKLALSSPDVTISSNVERFNTDSYSVRATNGINSVREVWKLKWIGLTTSEAKDVVNAIKGTKGVSLIQYRPLLSDVDKYYTSTEVSATPYNTPAGDYWTVDTTLSEEFDTDV